MTKEEFRERNRIYQKRWREKNPEKYHETWRRACLKYRREKLHLKPKHRIKYVVFYENGEKHFFHTYDEIYNAVIKNLALIADMLNFGTCYYSPILKCKVTMDYYEDPELDKKE